MSKVRTVIALEEEDKAWLDRESARRGMSMAQLIRTALRALRQATPPERPSFDEILESTRGLWSGGDGLDYQRRVRDEW